MYSHGFTMPMDAEWESAFVFTELRINTKVFVLSPVRFHHMGRVHIMLYDKLFI